MARLRYNNSLGLLGHAMLAGDTTITFQSPPAFATLSVPDYIPLVVDPPSNQPNGSFEVVYLTGYTAGSSTGTVWRGREGTNPVSHGLGAPWLCGPTVLDVTFPAEGTLDAEVQSFFMEMVSNSRGVDQNVGGLFGAIVYDSGVPSFGQVLWPDGAYGTFSATTINPTTSTAGEGGTIDEYTASYRRFYDTSASDRTDWAPHSSTAYLSGPPMSDAQAAQNVTRVPEIIAAHIAPFAPNPSLTARNYYIPTPSDLSSFYSRVVSEWLYPGHTQPGPNPQLTTINPYFQFVTGACAQYVPAPSTDEIIQWASHKWGIPTENLRAQCHLESRWNMDFLGDLNPVNANDPLIGGGEVDNNWALYPPWSRIPGGVFAWRSLSLIQVQWVPNSGIGPGSDPLRWMSTAFALDYACAFMRYYFDDPQGHRTAWGDHSYAAGDVRAQMGWFNPYPWAASGTITLPGVDGTSALDLTTIGIYGGWTATVELNATHPANKDLIVYNNGVVIKQFLNVTNGTIQNFVTAVMADDQLSVIASASGTGSVAVADVIGQAGTTGGAMSYWAGIQNRLASKPWRVADFSTVASAVTVYHQPLMTREAGSGNLTNRPLPDTLAFVPPTPPPGPPIDVVAYPGDGQMWIWWHGPVNDGGQAVQGWLIFETDQGWGAWQQYFGIGWLWGFTANGSPLRFSIQADNGRGWSPWSAPSNYATPTAGLPRQPSAVLASRDLVDGSITLSWSAPPA